LNLVSLTNYILLMPRQRKNERLEIKNGELAERLHAAAIHLLRRLRREDAASGLSGPRLSALSVVVFGGPLTLGQLAGAEGVKPPTMTRMVTGLEKDGLVVREPDTEDRRAVQIRATPAGQLLLFEGRARRVATLAAQLESLGKADLDSLETGVTVLESLLRSPK
jgi:DNA-binding MarR family transcriptional regulator